MTETVQPVRSNETPVIVRPPWLAELNKNAPKPVEPAIVEPVTEPISEPVIETVETVTEIKSDSTFGKLGQVSVLYDKDVAESVTKAGQEILRNTILPFAFDAVKFARSVRDSQDHAGDSLKADYFVPELDATSPFARMFNDHINTDGLTDGAFNSNQEPVEFPSFPEPTVIPSTQPFDMTLPEPPIKALAAQYDLPWMANLNRDMSALYDAHVMQVMSFNTVRASYLMRVKGINSQYVGIITNPELAERHIDKCLENGHDVGGWEDKYHKHIQKGVRQLEMGAQVKRNVEERVRFNIAIAKARQAWKDAIEDRKRKMDEMNVHVANLHETYNHLKNMSFDAWLVSIIEG